MSVFRVASAYSKALFNLASEMKVQVAVYEDMCLVEKTLMLSRDLRNCLSSPVIHLHQKEKIISSIFSGKVQPVTLSFFAMVVKKHREASLFYIAKEYIKLYKDSLGIQSATLTAVNELPEETRKEILGIVGKFTNKSVELEFKKDPSIIGGFVLSTNDKQIDASVRSKLTKIKQSILNRTTVIQ